MKDNPPFNALKRAVNRAIEEGSPAFVNLPSNALYWEFVARSKQRVMLAHGFWASGPESTRKQVREAIAKQYKTTPGKIGVLRCAPKSPIQLRGNS